MAFPGVKISRDRLRSAVENAHKSKAMIARELDISPGALFSYLKNAPGPARVDPEVFHRMLAVFGLSANDLLVNGVDSAPAGIADVPGGTLPIPEWSIEAKASAWAPATFAALDYDQPDQRRVIDAGLFRLRIDGDCMEPEYPSGMTVEFELIRIDRTPLEIGRDYVICNNEGMATFKQLRKITEDALIVGARNRKCYPKEIVIPHQQVVRIAVVAHRLAGPPPSILAKLK